MKYFHQFTALLLSMLVAFISITPVYANSLQDTGMNMVLPNDLQVNIAFTDKQVLALLSDGNQLTLVNSLDSIPVYARDVWIDDFDFDGFQDIAITTRHDSAQNNQYYSIFYWDKDFEEFSAMPFPVELSNLEIDPIRREVRSSYQAGNFWIEETYRFFEKSPYLYSKSELVVDGVWHTTTYDFTGEVIRSLVSDDGKIERPPQPVLLIVESKTAPLYSQPLPSTQQSEFLRRGDLVTILDFKRGPGEFYWVNVRCNLDNQILEGWTLLANLQGSESIL